MGTAVYPMRTVKEKRDAYLARWSQLKTDRSSWESHWQDLARHILPRASRLYTTDRNRGNKAAYQDILDNTATRAARVLSAGLMAGMTSPARPWFNLTTRDPNLRDSHDVRVWLGEVAELMRTVFAKSNLYRVLPRSYTELGVFGTSAFLVMSDFDTVIRCYPLTLGQYALQQDYQGRINTVYREFQRTVAEVVKEFGIENCSKAVQDQFQSRNLEAPVHILHVIEPRQDQERNPSSPTSENMPWASIYLEITGDESKILRESGFKRMRVLAPRWQVDGDDVYGVSPGMEALGDIKQLQQEQLRKSQAIDYKTKPPLQVPTSLQGRSHNGLPGGVRYYEPGGMIPFDQTQAGGGIRSAFEVTLELRELLEDIVDVRYRIDRAFYVDLFLMISQASLGQMTATEVVERQQEKLLMIGPVVERMNNELLEPLIDLTFQEMLEVGALPPAPEELLGAELEIEYVSILAQAQRAVGIDSTQQFVADVLNVSQARPDVLDVLNFDAWARKTAQMRGVSEDLLVDEDSVAQLRKARADAEAAQEQLTAQGEQAKIAKDLSATRADNGSALAAVLETPEI